MKMNIGLTFGPHNTSYKHMWTHMQLAGLSVIAKMSNIHAKRQEEAIASSSRISSENKQTEKSEGSSSDCLFHDGIDDCNVWSKLCDVTTCLEAPITANSPTGYAIDAAGAIQGTVEGNSYMNFTLPKPPESVACILPPEKFKVTAIVHRAEYLDISESPISLPPRYAKALQDKVEGIQHLRNMLGNLELSGGSSLERTINNNFIDWLVQTEKNNQIIDLIKLDSGAATTVNAATVGRVANAAISVAGGGLIDNDENEDDDDLFMSTT